LETEIEIENRVRPTQFNLDHKHIRHRNPYQQSLNFFPFLLSSPVIAWGFTVFMAKNPPSPTTLLQAQLVVAKAAAFKKQ